MGRWMHRPYRLSIVLASVSVLLTVVSAGLNLVQELAADADGSLLTVLVRLFDVRGEQTVQSWFSVLILAGAGALALAFGSRLRSAGRAKAVRWWGIGSALIVASLDEAVSIHELANNPDAPSGAFRFAWVYLAIPVVIFLAIWALPAIRSLPMRVEALVVTAGVLYIMGAVGMEFVGGFFFGTDIVYGAIAHVEELLEMVGVVVFIEAMCQAHRIPRDESGRLVWTGLDAPRSPDVPVISPSR